MSCTCSQCAAACRHIPGLFTPLEALRAIRAGHATDLMVVGYRPEKRNGRAWGETFEAMMPRSYPSRPRGSGTTPIDPHERRDNYDAAGTCIFFNVDNLCEIHDSGFKPFECRGSKLCKPEVGVTDEQRLGPWQTAVGRLVIKIWRDELADPAPAARARVRARRLRARQEPDAAPGYHGGRQAVGSPAGPGRLSPRSATGREALAGRLDRGPGLPPPPLTQEKNR